MDALISKQAYIKTEKSSQQKEERRGEAKYTSSFQVLSTFSHKSEINKRQQTQNSISMFFLKKDFVPISFSELLLLAGVELGHQRTVHINYLDKSKSSPLHLAVRGGNIEAIYFCIANGAKIDQQQVEHIIYELVHQNQ